MSLMSVEDHCKLKGEEFTSAKCVGGKNDSSQMCTDGSWKCPDGHQLVGRCCKPNKSELQSALSSNKKVLYIAGIGVLLGLAYFMYLEKAKV